MTKYDIASQLNDIIAELLTNNPDYDKIVEELDQVNKNLAGLWTYEQNH